MAVWEDAGFRAGGGGQLAARGASSWALNCPPSGGQEHADRALAATVEPAGGCGPLARDCCCSPFPFLGGVEFLRWGVSNIGQTNGKRDPGKWPLILRKLA